MKQYHSQTWSKNIFKVDKICEFKKMFEKLRTVPKWLKRIEVCVFSFHFHGPFFGPRSLK